MIEVSIGIPVYNAECSIETCISSIQLQIWKGDMEIIVYDDGSTDYTPDIINGMVKKDSRIQFFRNEKNKGRPYARNMLLEHATGKFFAWLDADDMWYPEKLHFQCMQLKTAYKIFHHDNIWCVSSCNINWNHKPVERYIPYLRNDQMKNILKGKLRAYLHTMLGSTESMRRIGQFDVNLQRLQDYDFFIRFVQNGGILIGTPPDLILSIYNKGFNGRSAIDIYTSANHIFYKHKNIFLSYGKHFLQSEMKKYIKLSAKYALWNREWWIFFLLILRYVMRSLGV
jgi:glycosyltransferase involved in cell wall biosynthesis